MGIVNKQFVKVILLSLFFLSASLITVQAQEPVEEEESIVVTPSGRLNLTFEELGFETRGLNRDRTTLFYQLNLPGNFQILPTGNYLDLTTSHLPEAPDKPAWLEVGMNGQLVSSFALTRENAISSTVRLELESGLINTGYNGVYVELNTGATCQEPGAFLEVLVDGNSTLNFGYQQTPYPTDLGLYPYPFTEQSLLNIPVAIVLPDQPTENILSAAAIIAAGLGQSSGGTVELTTVLASDLTPEIQNNYHLIVIGRPDQNLLYEDLTLPVAIDDSTLGAGQGLLQEVVSPWNEFRVILTVSGLDEQGILKASQALNRQAHFLGMRGPVAVVLEIGDLPKATTIDTPSFTLASLNYEDRVVYGTLPQEFNFDFFLPLGWQLAESPFFVLKFGHADIITPESAIDVTLNGVPIGSSLLDQTNAEEGELTISLPERLLKTGRNRLEVGIEMKLANVDECAGLQNQRAWTVISNESEIFLPYRAVNVPIDLGLFPYPFSQASGFEQMAFVLPDQSSAQIFDDLIQIAARLGSSTAQEQFFFTVGYASKIDQAIFNNHNLILLGLPTENTLLAEINAYLPQPFVADGNIPEPLAVDSVAFLPDPNRDAGFLEIIGSPWNEELSLLAITGTSDEGAGMAVQALLEQTQQLEGNLAVVEPVFDLFEEQPHQITTYSIDTRPNEVISTEQSAASSAIPEQDLADLANRWWQ